MERDEDEDTECLWLIYKRVRMIARGEDMELASNGV